MAVRFLEDLNVDGTLDSGQLSVNHNAGALNMVGTDHTYMQWYPAGLSGGRHAYTGFAGGGTNHFTIANETSGANIDLTTNSGTVNVTGNLSVSGTVDGVDIGANYANWNTAYGWGDHASAGYLTSSSTQSKYLRSDADDYFTGKLNWDGADYADGINMSLGNINDAHYIKANEFRQRLSGRPRNNLGDPTITEMALFEEQFGPKTTLANDYDDLSDLTFWGQETSSSSWVEITSYSDDQKRKFLRTNNSSVIIPNTYYKFRVEFTAKSYTFANAMYMYWSSNSHNTQVHIWKKRCSDGTWLQHTSATNTISSWPGHGWLPFPTIPWNETNTTSTSHATDIRVEFTPNWSTGSNGYRDINIYGMQIWGGYPKGRRTPHYYDQNGEFNFLKDAHLQDGKVLKLGTGNDLQLLHDGSNSYIHHNGAGSLFMKADTGNINIINYTNDADIILQSDDGAGGVTPYLTLDGSVVETKFNKDLRVIDNEKIIAGTSNDLEIFSSGASVHFRSWSGDMTFQQNANDKDIIFQSDDGSGGVTPYLTLDGSETKTIVSQTMEFQDNVKLAVGNSEDLIIDHNGTDSRVINYTGDLRIVNSANDKDITLESDDGSGGVTPYLTLDGSTTHSYFSAGNVGIGTDSPTYTLDVETSEDIIARFSSTDNKGAIAVKDDDTTAYISAENSRIGFGTSPSLSTQNITMLTGNNFVGIGVISPAVKLDVAGDAQLQGTSPRLVMKETGTSKDFSLKVQTDGRFSFINDNLASEVLTIEQDGDVGIGTTSPNAKLSVKSSSTNNWVFRATASDGGDLGGIYEDGGTNAELYIKNSAGTSSVLINSSGDSYLNGGDVGIGTTSPAKKLDVNGDTNITGYLDLKTSSPTGSPLLRFYQSTTRRGFIQMADTNNNLRVASEYGSVSLEAAATSGVDSDTSYIRIKPGGTVEIGAVDGDATISTDGSMTFKIDADNDETSQKFSFVNNAGTEVASIDESGNLTLTGNISLSLPSSPGSTGTLWNDRGIVRYVE